MKTFLASNNNRIDIVGSDKRPFLFDLRRSKLYRSRAIFVSPLPRFYRAQLHATKW